MQVINCSFSSYSRWKPYTTQAATNKILDSWVVVVVVVDLYSASRSASNALIVLCATKRWVFRADLKPSVLRAGPRSEWVWMRVPFHRTRNGKSPTTKRAATVSWNHQLVTVGLSKALTSWDVRCKRAIVHQVLRNLILQTPVNCDFEFILDTLWNVQPR